MFLREMEACLAEELGKQHQELLETTWEQLKGEELKGCSYLSLSIKLHTKRNPDLYFQEMLSFPKFSHKLLDWL